MADDDIYKNQSRYDRFKQNLEEFALPPAERKYPSGKFKYYCRYPLNIRHFRAFFQIMEARDTSYVRRNRLCSSMKLICHVAKKDLADIQRADINAIVAFMHRTYRSPKSKSDFLKDFRFLWRQLFSENDEHGRPDESITPYAVRHLSTRIDKSRERRRQDKLTWEEFESLMNYFSKDCRLQCYLAISTESLGRPQEILYVRIRDVELHDNYAKIWISEHGKEGTGFLQCIDSYPYLLKWLESHPVRGNADTYLFVNTGGTNLGAQLTPSNINVKLKAACKHLGINKPITAYSLKRNGVTMRRLRGESDMEIQHAARWTSTKQLKTYDMSDHDDAMRMALAKRGLLPAESHAITGAATKTCGFCETVNGFNALICSFCKRPLDRLKIVEEEKERKAEISGLKEEMENMKLEMASRSAMDDDLNRFMEIPQVQELFKQLHKVRREAHEKTEHTAVKTICKRANR